MLKRYLEHDGACTRYAFIINHYLRLNRLKITREYISVIVYIVFIGWQVQKYRKIHDEVHREYFQKYIHYSLRYPLLY